jgi:hypothetical protein
MAYVAALMQLNIERQMMQMVAGPGHGYSPNPAAAEEKVVALENRLDIRREDRCALRAFASQTLSSLSTG